MNAPNVNPIIESVLSGMMYRGKAVPLSHLVRKGFTITHITYQTIDESTSGNADDEPTEGETTAVVDVFVEMLGNYKAFAYSVRDRLKSEGFTIIGFGPEQYESDTNLYHVPIDIYRGSADG